jgi:hypothetical protein
VESRDRKGIAQHILIRWRIANICAEIKDLRSAIKVQRALLAEGGADDTLGEDDLASIEEEPLLRPSR